MAKTVVEWRIKLTGAVFFKKKKKKKKKTNRA